MSSVALCGFAPNTLPLAMQTDADEVWSIVWAYKYKELPRLDRLFEVHPVWVYANSGNPAYAKSVEHDAWLRQNRSIPVYTTEYREEWPMSIPYPREEVRGLLKTWTRSGRNQKMLTSSFDFMMGLAVLEGFERIEIYGAEMETGTEFAYQREGFAFWAGLCIGRGIEFVQFDSSNLLNKTLEYGYDGVQMISRQDLERELRNLSADATRLKAHVQYLEGAADQAKEALVAYRDEVQETQDQGREVNVELATIVLDRLKKEWSDKLEQLEKTRLDMASLVGAESAVKSLISKLDLVDLDIHYGYNVVQE